MSKKSKPKSVPATAIMLPENMPQFFWRHLVHSRTDDSVEVPTALAGSASNNKKVTPFTWAACGDLINKVTKQIEKLPNVSAQQQQQQQQQQAPPQQKQQQQQPASAESTPADKSDKKGDTAAPVAEPSEAKSDDATGEKSAGAAQPATQEAAAPQANANDKAGTNAKQNANAASKPAAAAPASSDLADAHRQALPSMPTSDTSKAGQKQLRYKCSRPLCEVVASEDTPLLVCAKCQSSHYCSRGASRFEFAF
jgi:hypothetical protein